MRILITGLLLFLAFGLFGQTVRTVGVVYTASAPVHTPSGQGAWIAVDTTSGSWYEWERTTGVWRDAGYRVQLTNTTGVPSYTPSKARGRVALNSGDSLYAYQAGAWACLNCVVAPDLSGYVEYSDSNTIYITPDQLSDSLSALPDSIMSGYGVAGYLPQYFSATKFDTTGVYWDATTGRLGIGIASSLLARTHIKGPGTTSSTTALLVENSAGTDIMSCLDSRTTWFGSSVGYDGTVEINTAAHANRLIKIGSFEFTQGGGPTWTGQGIRVDGANRSFIFTVSNSNTSDNSAFTILGSGISAGAGFSSKTSGEIDWAYINNAGFSPTSGSAIFNQFTITGTINQTGGASGITRGLFVEPILTSAADWRSVEMSNNSGFGIYQSGANAKNYFNGKVGFGTATPVASARVEIASTTEGFLPPRMTTAQRDAIASPATGLMLFCTDCTATDGSTGVSQTYSSGTWKNHY